MDQNFSTPSKSFLFYIFLVVAALGAAFFISREEAPLDFKAAVFYTANPVKTIVQAAEKIKLRPDKVAVPDYVRGLYLTAYSAGKDDFRQAIIKKMSSGHINAVVIDIKDSYGRVLYPSNLEMAGKIGATFLMMPDVRKVIDDFHEAGIYTIARQVVFQDPALAQSRPDLALKTKSGNIWYNYNGLAFTDPQATEVWGYNAAIAKEAVELGFDEINFDYIRYPSDGPLSTLNYNLPAGKTKADVLKSFFVYLSDQLKDQAKISADLFGLVMDNAKTGYDLGIGQRLADTVDYFDFVSPMMYASHYADGYLGFVNPAAYPAEVVSYGLKISAPFMEGKRATVRPWLQAFNLGATYDSVKIKVQEEAAENATTTSGWLLWNARNYYPDYIFEK